MKKWAFIIHPRDMVDMAELNGHIPEFLLRQIVKRMKPRVVSHVTSEKSEGWLIGCFLFPNQFYNSSLDFVQTKILKSVLFAKELGVKVIGLGELISPFTFGGKWLVRKVPGVLFTSGNSLTAETVVEDMRRIFRLMNSNSDKSDKIRIAIIGATGSVGTPVSQMQRGKNLILVARNRQKLERLRLLIKSDNRQVVISTNTEDIKIADLVIVLTSSSDVVIKPEHLKVGSIVYDITQPSNLAPEITEKNDITVIKGGLMKKMGLELNFDLRIPRGTAFACLVETILLGGNYESQFFSQSELVGQVKVNVAEKMFALAEEHGFESNLNFVETSLKK